MAFMFLHRLDLCCPAGEVGSRDEVAARAGGLADSVLGVAADAADAVRFPSFNIHTYTLLCSQPPQFPVLASSVSAIALHETCTGSEQ